MYQQYLNQAVSSLGHLSSDDLKDLLNDDDKLDDRVNDAVSTLSPLNIYDDKNSFVTNALILKNYKLFSIMQYNKIHFLNPTVYVYNYEIYHIINNHQSSRTV